MEKIKNIIIAFEWAYENKPRLFALENGSGGVEWNGNLRGNVHYRFRNQGNIDIYGSMLFWWKDGVGWLQAT